MPLKEKTIAPDFSLFDENKKDHRLSDYKGKPVLLYFYSKDNTPGCTTEACSFRDNYSAFQKVGLEIVGVSPDSPESHTKFKSKYYLPFTLLADEGHKVCELYGVWGRKKFMGREFDGVLRTTFLIDDTGLIIKVFENVKPSEHSADVLVEFSKLR